MEYAANFLNEDMNDGGPDPYEGVLDSEYRNRELPDDFFLDVYQDRLRDDPEVIIAKDRIHLPCTKEGEMVTNHVMMVDISGESEVVRTGSKYVQPPQIRIKPDFTPAMMVMQYYFDYMEGKDIIFPYIPVAAPSIPPTAKEKGRDYYLVDDFMAKKNALILSPYYKFQERASVSDFVSWERDDLMQENCKLRMPLKKFLFSSRTFIPKWAEELYPCAALEFNPTHPLAPPYIVDYEDDGKVIKGHYKWGRSIRPFVFNRRDTRYRIHSDMWYAILGHSDYFFSMFDLVSNFDILNLLPELMRYKYKFYSFAPVRLVRGYQIVDESKLIQKKFCQGDLEKKTEIYSSMTQLNSNKIFENYDETKTIRNYYSNAKVQIKHYGSLYYDVTREYDLKFYAGERYETMVVHKLTGRIEMRIMKSELKSRYEENKDIFVQFSARYKHFKVYTLSKPTYVPVESQKFVYVEGAHFIGCPRNSTGSLMFNPSVVSFDDFVRDVKENKDGGTYLRSMNVIQEHKAAPEEDNFLCSPLTELDDDVEDRIMNMMNIDADVGLTGGDDLLTRENDD